MDEVNGKLAELWREWFKIDGNPTIATLETDVVNVCFFCSCYITGSGDDEHFGDCVYVRAKELVE